MLTDATADLAFALLLALARRLPEGERDVREGQWVTFEPDRNLGAEVTGATLGIVGFGRIGQAVARRAEGFGMEVLHSARSGGVPLEELLERSDFVTLHCPLTPDTRHLIDAAALDAHEADRAARQHRARPDRRPRARSSARCTSARSPAPRSTSPTPSRCPPTTRCCSAPNLLVVPHVGSATVRTRHKMTEIAVDNLLAALAGEPMPHQAN